MAIYYVSHNSGDDANDGTSWANAVKNIGAASILANTPGDEVRIEKSPDPVSTAVNATFDGAGGDIELDTPLTADIDMCDSGWTASSGTVSYNTTLRKEGSADLAIGVTSNTEPKKLAYKAIGGETGLDLSAFEQLSFWFRATAHPTVDGEFQIRLCSDTEGDVAVDTLNLPALGLHNWWQACTVDKGSSLGSAIKSVAIWTNENGANKTIYLDCIFACGPANADSTITLHTLIGKNKDDDGWFHPVSIVGTTIKLGAGPATINPTTYPGYNGASESTLLYKINPFLTLPVSSTSADINYLVNIQGTDSNHIKFLGGWEYDTTNQNGESFYCGSNGLGRFLNLYVGNSYVDIENISCSYYHVGISLAPNVVANYNKNITINIANLTGNSYGIYISWADEFNISITNVNNNFHGIYCLHHVYNSIFNCTNLNSNGTSNQVAYGLYFNYSSNNTLNIDKILGNRFPIGFLNSSYNILNFIDIKNSMGGSGVTLTSNSNFNIISGQNISDNYHGLHILNSSYNNFQVNSVINSDRDNIKIENSIFDNFKISSEITNAGISYYNILLENSSNITFDCPVNTGPCRSGVYPLYSYNIKIKNTIFSNFAWADIVTSPASIYLDNVEHSATVLSPAQNDGRLFEVVSTTIEGAPLNHEIFVYNGTISTNTAHLKYGDFSWKLSPTYTYDFYYIEPIFGPISKLYVKTGQKFNFRVWAKRDNTGIDGGIRIRPDGLNGLTTALESVITADADTWQQLEIPFTATTDTLLTIEQFAYGGSTYNLYIDPYQLLGANSFVNGDIINVPSPEKISTF